MIIRAKNTTFESSVRQWRLSCPLQLLSCDMLVCTIERRDLLIFLFIRYFFFALLVCFMFIQLQFISFTYFNHILITGIISGHISRKWFSSPIDMCLVKKVHADHNMIDSTFFELRMVALDTSFAIVASLKFMNLKIS